MNFIEFEFLNLGYSLALTPYQISSPGNENLPVITDVSQFYFLGTLVHPQTNDGFNFIRDWGEKMQDPGHPLERRTNGDEVNHNRIYQQITTVVFPTREQLYLPWRCAIKQP